MSVCDHIYADATVTQGEPVSRCLFCRAVKPKPERYACPSCRRPQPGRASSLFPQLNLCEDCADDEFRSRGGRPQWT